MLDRLPSPILEIGSIRHSAELVGWIRFGFVVQQHRAHQSQFDLLVERHAFHFPVVRSL